MTPHNPTTILAIGTAPLPTESSQLDVYTATTLRETLATIRLICFDLIMVGLEDPKLDIWDLMQRVTIIWPSQRWILASESVSNVDEIHARSLGALLVLHEVPEQQWLVDFSASLRQRDLSRSIRSGSFVSDPSRVAV